MDAETRGSISFFSTYRPPVPLDIYSCPILVEDSNRSELLMTDGVSYNYNGRDIPPPALKALLNSTLLPYIATTADVDSGRLTGIIFVSERNNLETLHFSFCFNAEKPKVVSFADAFGTSTTFDGVRMEDSGSMAGDTLIYVSTKQQAIQPRQPWTAVYKTNIQTGKTDRLTPSRRADICPAVSPSGKQILVASFRRKGWTGANEDLKTDIFVMNIEKPFNRRMVVVDAGWPTWGSDNIIFFHRKVGKFWGVFRADISSGDIVSDTLRVTPDAFHAITPAALSATTVASATIRQKSELKDIRVESQYRQIEIFDITRGPQHSVQITSKKADHFNPFVIDGGKGIGYHCCKRDLGIDRQCQMLNSPNPDVGLVRVSGAFPTFSKDGSKFAFTDNESNSVWVADNNGLHLVWEVHQEEDTPNLIFSPVWNQNAERDTLYICVGPSFRDTERVNIIAIPRVSRFRRMIRVLTNSFNNAFPSSSPDGTRLVFRSNRGEGCKNLYIMEDAEMGDFGDSTVTRLTNGPWTDTHCQWSPTGDWIVFSSTRDKPKNIAEDKSDLGYFALYLVKADDPEVVVRVMASGTDFSGYVNHPCFSPDGCSIVVSSDLAAVSVDPISLPLLEHSVRPYGDIFTIDIDTDDISNDKDLKNFNRITHSRYGNGAATWTRFSSERAHNKLLIDMGDDDSAPTCPHANPDGGESWHMTGHLCVSNRGC